MARCTTVAVSMFKWQNMASSHANTLLPPPNSDLRALFPRSPESIASLLSLVLRHVQTAVSDATSNGSNSLMVMNQIERFINSIINSIPLFAPPFTSPGYSDPNLVRAMDAYLTALTRSVTECFKGFEGLFPAAGTSPPKPPITLASGEPPLHEQSNHQDELEPGKGEGRETPRPLDPEFVSEVNGYLEKEHRKWGGRPRPTGTGGDPIILDGLDEDGKRGRSLEDISLEQFNSDRSHESPVPQALQAPTLSSSGERGTEPTFAAPDAPPSHPCMDASIDNNPAASSHSQPASSYSGAETAEDECRTDDETAQMGQFLIEPRVDHPTVNARGRRVRKGRVLDPPFGLCVCDRQISQGEIDAGILVMKCKIPGCEIVWFHQECMDYDLASSKDWICPCCKPVNKSKRRRTLRM